MNRKIQFFTLLVLSIIFFGLFAFAFAPKAEADDFWDEFVDFLDPVKHIENIIDGRPQDNLPPIPDFSRDRERGRDRDYIPLPYPTVFISANPSNVDYGGSSTITWNSNYATYCDASGGTNGWSGNIYASGTFFTGNLTNTTTFYISCTNSTGQVNNQVTVYVNNQIQNPTVNISANPSNVDYNGSSVITWNSNNATSCNASGGSNGWSGSKSTSGTFFTGNLINITTFYISCTNSTGQASDQVTVSVNDNNNDDENPTVSLRADESNIDFEENTILRWSSNNATRCDASGGTNGWSDDNVGTHGTFNTGSLDSDETYRITCRNNDGDTDTDSITIRVEDDDDNDRNDEPDVTTRSATSVSTGGATLNGRVAGNGSSVRAWFEYGPNNNFGYSTSKNSYGSRSTNYSKSISGLIPNTTYYFRAVAENSDDIAYGSIFSFNTGNSFVNVVSNQPTVIIYADQTNIPFNSSTNIRWNTTEATSCSASGGSIGWAGVKNIGSGFFNTGLLTATRTYTITCSNNVGSSTDSVTVIVRRQVITTPVAPAPKPTPTSIVLINSSVDLNQPIVSALDNTRPHAGDEINYTVGYQNIGTGSITNLVLQIALPQAVDYMFSNGGSNPTVFGSTLIFNLGTLRANGEGTITARARVKDNIPTGMNLNFPATLSYIDPSGLPQSVTTNVSAQVWNEPGELTKDIPLEANVFGAGFLPTNLFGWLLLIILVLLLILLAKYLFGSGQFLPFSRQTVSTFNQPSGKKTTTTTIHE